MVNVLIPRHGANINVIFSTQIGVETNAIKEGVFLQQSIYVSRSPLQSVSFRYSFLYDGGIGGSCLTPGGY